MKIISFKLFSIKIFGQNLLFWNNMMIKYIFVVILSFFFFIHLGLGQICVLVRYNNDNIQTETKKHHILTNKIKIDIILIGEIKINPNTEL